MTTAAWTIVPNRHLLAGGCGQLCRDDLSGFSQFLEQNRLLVLNLLIGQLLVLLHSRNHLLLLTCRGCVGGRV